MKITTLDIIQSLTCTNCPACQIHSEFDYDCIDYKNIMECTRIKNNCIKIMEVKNEK